MSHSTAPVLHSAPAQSSSSHQLHRTGASSTVLCPSTQYWDQLHGTGSSYTALAPAAQYGDQLHSIGARCTVLGPAAEYWGQLHSIGTGCRVLGSAQTDVRKTKPCEVHAEFIVWLYESLEIKLFR